MSAKSILIDLGNHLWKTELNILKAELELAEAKKRLRAMTELYNQLEKELKNADKEHSQAPE